MVKKMSSLLTEVSKTEVPQHVIDEAANVVLAYAMGAAFLLKNSVPRTIMTASLFRVMLNMYMVNYRSSVDIDSMEQRSGTSDQISLRIPVSDEAQTFIIHKINNKHSEQYVILEHIATFLNNDVDFNNLVDQLSNNGIQNRIVIDVDSVGVDRSA